MALYLRPESLADALAALRQNPALALLSGATDIYPVQTTRQAWFQPHARDMLDLSGIRALRGIMQEVSGFRIGALTTWTDVLTAKLPPAFDALKQAAKQVGGVQIQNRGTLGGNICNASPAADGLPPLLALDAEVEVASAAGRRTVPLRQFVLGNRKTALQRGEIVTALLVPSSQARENSVFLKLGARHYLVISIASVAANLTVDAAGHIADVRIAVGACSAVPLRLHGLEKALTGRPVSSASQTVTPAHLADLSPIDDVRATGLYRSEAALVLVKRALESLAHLQVSTAGQRAAVA